MTAISILTSLANVSILNTKLTNWKSLYFHVRLESKLLLTLNLVSI